MGSKCSSNSYFANQSRPFILSLIFFLSLALILLASLSPRKPTTGDIFPTTRTLEGNHHHEGNIVISDKQPEWFKIIAKELNGSNSHRRKKIKLGLVNLEGDALRLRGLHGLDGDHDQAEMVAVRFDRLVGPNRPKWEDFYPEWIDENHRWGPPRCPLIPLPPGSAYDDLDVVVAEVPCGTRRDVFALQVNLVVANLAVRSGWVVPDVHRTVYVVFVGSCGPMLEIFRCDDLMRKRKESFWLYKPEMRRLKQKMVMPFGSCEIAPPYAQEGKEDWRELQPPRVNKTTTNQNQHRGPRYAYATVLHSSESYVCGAIALAQSIRRTRSTKDLILLADRSIGPEARQGLRSAGWQVLTIDRIRSPFAKKGSYNEWNYSKLRLWQLAGYDKLVFIDADLLVLNNLDSLFFYPQLSAAGNDKVLFNSGVMVIEPSNCLFEVLTRESFRIESYNGGDQGFLNEVFTWWHRLPKRINYLKIFRSKGDGSGREVGEDIDAIHYLGLKPWMCYRDYDCNWDMEEHHIFASDSAHRRWWEVYDAMPENLQAYCRLTKKMEQRIEKWRGIAMKADLPDGHWKIQAMDPRRQRFAV
ncbi:Glycosyl transferase [Parasponia andersonii]|uniref:Hexosyltransferase n=1 Tax=Parasponia andersonii TaxID=3476 RepID=A0A2P5DSZ2_PARAD|nr:Glycosyl transferase [Parasponia andersonii]